MAPVALQVVVLAASVALAAAGGSVSGTAAAGQARQRALEDAWSRELDSAQGMKKSPVQRVVKLLQKMKSELEAEAANEAGMYDKMVCWCETNEKEKTQAVAAAETADGELSAEIEGRAARFGELSASVAKLKEQIATDSDALSKATALREKEAEEFRAEEQDQVQAITNLQNAIAVLSKHQGSSLAQVDRPLLSGLRVLLRDAALKYEMISAGKLEQGKRQATALLALAQQGKGQEATETDKALLSALDSQGGRVGELPLDFAARVVARAAGGARKAASGNFLQADGSQPGMYESRSSARSSQIFGILQQMLADFKGTLATSQADEAQAKADYEALAAAKEDQITAAKKKLDDLEQENAANQKALSDAKEDLTNTREQRSKDVEFLQNLKLTCNDLSAQWEKRSKTRAAETKAVAEAVAILTEDDNREMLAKSVSLLQVRQRSVSSAQALRARAVSLLRRAAQSPSFQADDLLDDWHGRKGAAPSVASSSPRAQLATLALSAQLDTFTKVKEMMDKMVATLKEEQEQEVKFKAYCGKELNQNEKAVHTKGGEKKDLEGSIADLEALLEKLSKEIAESNDRVAEAKVQIKKASENREKENAEFQTTVADQRATQEILKKALAKLKDFYQKGIGKAVLAQQKQEPPVKFNAYKANAGASPVIGLIEQIVEDSAKLEAEATATEQQAQADYEGFVKDSTALISQLSEGVTLKSKASSAAKLEKAQAEQDLGSTVSELESLAAYKADLHSQCDFVLKNFDIRQKARLEEIEAIQAAKGILSGASAQF